MDSRRLQYFLAVYENGSLGRAAAALDLTQPALSKSIHQLERELKVQLFDRTPKGLVPTVYGDTLSLHARAIQSELRNAEREISLLSNAAKGTVRIGVTPSVAGTLMPSVVARIREERPGIVLSVIEGLVQTHGPALRRSELDLVVGGWAGTMDGDLATEVVGSDQVGVYARANHPLAGARTHLPALLAYPWVMPPHTEFWLDHLDRAFVAAGLGPPAPAVVSNSASFVLGSITRGNFLTYLPAQLFEGEEKAGRVVCLDVRELIVPLSVNVTYRARAALPASVAAVIGAIRDACDKPEP